MGYVIESVSGFRQQGISWTMISDRMLWWNANSGDTGFLGSQDTKEAAEHYQYLRWISCFCPFLAIDSISIWWNLRVKYFGNSVISLPQIVSSSILSLRSLLCCWRWCWEEEGAVTSVKRNEPGEETNWWRWAQKISTSFCGGNAWSEWSWGGCGLAESDRFTAFCFSEY